MTYEDFIFALTLWREARSCTYAARVGVSWVIRNRAKVKSIVQVCIQPYQFSGMTAPGDLNLVKWPAEDDPEMLDCLAIAQTIGTDPTGEASFYFTAPLTKPPAEWGNVVETVAIDGIHFARAVT